MPRASYWRIRKLVKKAHYTPLVRRFKMLGYKPNDPMPTELDWELWVLDQLEQEAAVAMAALGISTEDQKYYLGFLKRLWERRVHFSFLTFTEEKEILITEYILRGWDETTLRTLQAIAESWALIKGAPWLRVPLVKFTEGWGYEEPPFMSLLFSEPWSFGDPIGLVLKFSENWNYTEPPSMNQKFVEVWSS